MNMKGAWVEFQTDLDSYGEGRVIAHNERTGDLVIRDDDGIHWRGAEDHIEVIVQPSERDTHAG
jgi:hypothetical protein